MARDEFSKSVAEILAKRVGLLCSNPDCARITSGPHTEPSKAINVGVAAHITAASPSGPRFDPTLKAEERRSAENGIWLCQTCGKLVDNDPVKYQVDLLRKWKLSAEIRSLRELTGEAESDLRQMFEADLDLRSNSSLQHYFTALREDVTYLDSPVIDTMTSLAKLRLRDVFVSVQAVSTAPRLSADVLVREGIEKVLRGVRYSSAQPIELSESAILDSLKNSWQATRLETPRSKIGQLVDSTRALVLLGPPGAGKSTSLRYVALTRCLKFFSEDVPDPEVPFLIRLGGLISTSDDSSSLASAIGVYLKSTYGEHAYHSFVAASSRGRALLLLDGLDEIGTLADKTRLVLKVQDFSRVFLGRGNRVVITSRIVGYRTHRPLSHPFEHFAIADLDNAAARALVGSLVRELNEKLGRALDADEVSQVVADIERVPGAETLLSSPLTATMLAARSVLDKPTPHSKTELYQQVADLLEGEWETLTGREPAFSKKYLTHAISSLARWTLDNRPSGLITYHEADDAIVRGLVTHYQATRIDAEQVSRALLLHIRASSGILVEQTPGLLGFSHKSLLEFYAAVSIVRSDSTWREDLSPYLYRPDSTEVCRFAVGIQAIRHVGSGEAFLSQLLLEDRSIGSPLHRQFLRALICAPEIQHPTGDLVTKLSGALSDILFDIRAIPYGDGHLVYRPTMFAAFRQQLMETLNEFRRFRRHSEVVSNVILKYRGFADSQRGDYEPAEAEVFASKKDSPNVIQTVRTLNLLIFFSTCSDVTKDVFEALDGLLTTGNDETKGAVVRCLLTMGLRRRDPGVVSRLEHIVRSNDFPFAYGNYKCDSVSALCRLDHQAQWFLRQLDVFLREKTTFESYAVVAGLPFMSDTPAMRQLCERALGSENLAVVIDFVRTILMSKRAQQSLWLQECLARAFKVSTYGELRWLSLAAIADLDWHSADLADFLTNLVFDRGQEGWVRHYAARNLRRSGLTRLTELAADALGDSDPAVRYAGVCFSAASGVLLEPFVEPLLRLAKDDPDDGVRGDAYRVLAEHGYANSALTSAFIASAMSAGWDSPVRINAIELSSPENMTKDLTEKLTKLVEEGARISDGHPRHEFHPDGACREAYNAAIILTQGGLSSYAAERILTAAMGHQSNQVRERVYQDFGIAHLPSPVLLRLLLSAVETENEFILGKPSLYRTLDRIGSISEESLLDVLDVCDESSDNDVLGFCCGIVHRALQAPGFTLERRPSSDAA